jgi:hypothetical protein
MACRRRVALLTQLPEPIGAPHRDDAIRLHSFVLPSFTSTWPESTRLPALRNAECDLPMHYMHCFILSMCCARISGDMSFMCASIIAFRSWGDIAIIFLCMSHIAVMSTPDVAMAPAESDERDMDGLAHPPRSAAPMIVLKISAEVVFMMRPVNKGFRASDETRDRERSV